MPLLENNTVISEDERQQASINISETGDVLVHNIHCTEGKTSPSRMNKIHNPIAHCTSFYL